MANSETVRGALRTGTWPLHGTRKVFFHHITTDSIRFMLVVLDTDVLVAGLRSPAGASAELLRRARKGQLQLAASVALFMEYEAVCLRPEHVRAAGLKAREVQMFLDALAALVVPVQVHFLWRPQLHDAADELVLEAAVNAQAETLITFNTRHFAAAAPRFSLRLAVPGDFLRSL